MGVVPAELFCIVMHPKKLQDRLWWLSSVIFIVKGWIRNKVFRKNRYKIWDTSCCNIILSESKATEKYQKSGRKAKEKIRKKTQGGHNYA